MTRIATIRIEPDESVWRTQLRRRVKQAGGRLRYQGEHFSFSSPAALFKVLSPKRWELIERLQARGPLGARALARALDRDVKRVYEDCRVLLEIGLVERDAEGRLQVPFREIRAEFVLGAAA
jgi:predicted transcriptional regulator